MQTINTYLLFIPRLILIDGSIYVAFNRLYENKALLCDRFATAVRSQWRNRAVHGSLKKMAEEDKSAELLKEKANNYFKGNSQYL